MRLVDEDAHVAEALQGRHAKQPAIDLQRQQKYVGIETDINGFQSDHGTNRCYHQVTHTKQPAMMAERIEDASDINGI